MIDRKTFYDTVRHSPFSKRLTQQQVDGMNDLLDAWEQSGYTDLRWLAYILGGVYHEAGKRMVPVREGFAKTDASARKIVAARRYGKPAGPYGHVYYGRGRIQNTWLENYRKLEARFGQPFVKEPDRLLESKIDALVTIHGHAEGIWTGKELADYFNDTDADWINARRIINGTDKASTIAGYAKAFYVALLDATEKPEPVEPDPSRQPDDPGPIDASAPSLWQRIFKGVGGSDRLT